MNKRPSITRQDFIAAFMARGLTWEKSVLAYEAMCGVVADAIVVGAKINIGNVLSLSPTWKANRTVVMGFKRDRGTGDLSNSTRTYHLGQRLRYKVSLFRAFIRDHHLHWF